MSTLRVAPYLFLYVHDINASRRFYEGILGLESLEIDPSCVKYDVGEMMLALNRASDCGIDSTGKRDPSLLIVFHVEDLDIVRSTLEKRGVLFNGATDRYEIGAIAGFYDPDGHLLMLYQPSDDAMTWESATVMRRILAGTSRDATILATKDVADLQEETELPGPLRGRKLIYLFYFVTDAAEAEKFFGSVLGLQAVEYDPHAGVVKYDAGGVLVATHLVETEANASADATDVGQPHKSALVFLTDAIHDTMSGIRTRAGISDLRCTESEIGLTAKLTDPNGHMFFVYEPSASARSWPSGAKIEALAESFREE